MKIHELDKKAKEIAKNYKRLESQLLNVIIEIEQKKAFYKLGFNSLFAYVTKALELSPSQAYNFIKVARKSIEVPQLKTKIEQGQLSISKAQKMTDVLNPANKEIWFQLAQTKTHKQLEREVAIAQPQTAIKEMTSYQNSNLEISERVSVKRQLPRVELKIGLSEKTMLQFRRAQDLESGKAKSNKNLEQTLEAILEIYLNKTDPMRIAKRQKIKGKLDSQTKNLQQEIPETKNPLPCVKKTNSHTKRRPIPKIILHNLQLKTQGRCSFVEKNGERCTSRRYIQVHHIHPVAKGGDNNLENLTLLCSGHHRMIHANE